MIVSVFVRRLKEGCTFADFVTEWEADSGFGVPTRVFNATSLDDPRDVISVEVHTEHDVTDAPSLIPLGSPASLLGPLEAP